MDYKKFEVHPNTGTTSKFLYKVVEIRVFDSGHTSTPETVDFFDNIHDATLACEELNQKEPK